MNLFQENRIWGAALIQNNETAALTLPLEDIKYETRPEKYLQIVVFVDRIFPSFVSKYVQGGYVVLILFFIKRRFSASSYFLIFHSNWYDSMKE